MNGQYKDLPSDLFPGRLLKQEADYFISYDTSQATCSSDEKLWPLLDDATQSFHKALGIYTQ